MNEYKTFVATNHQTLIEKTVNVKELTTRLQESGIISRKSRDFILRLYGDAFKTNELFSRIQPTNNNITEILTILRETGNGYVANLLMRIEHAGKTTAITEEKAQSLITAATANSTTPSVRVIIPASSQSEPSLVTITKISFNPLERLGQGGFGAVFAGKFENRHVAVKRVFLDESSQETMNREARLLQECDHPNIIRYYCSESKDGHLYIALDLCLGTLEDLVKGQLNAKCDLNPRIILKEITSGLAHLHSLNILHRDLKPSNILIREVAREPGGFRALISDFGLSKEYPDGVDSMTQSRPFGSMGWIAPESLHNFEHSLPPKRITRAVDIFSLGCIFYFVLTKGDHPFGKEHTRRSGNILDGIYSIEKINSIDSRGARNLIGLMIDSGPENRPCASEILFHPCLWSEKKILNFFGKVSATLAVSNNNSNEITKAMLESQASHIIGNNWMDVIDSDVAQLLTKRRYNKMPYQNTVKELVRALRNISTHYDELPEGERRVVGATPEQFLGMFLDKFPHLLIHVWKVFEKRKTENGFSIYYSQALSSS